MSDEPSSTPIRSCLLDEIQFIFVFIDVLFFIVLCYVMLCYAMLCYVMLWLTKNKKGDLAHVTTPRGFWRKRTGAPEGEGRPGTCNGASGFAEKEDLQYGRGRKT